MWSSEKIRDTANIQKDSSSLINSVGDVYIQRGIFEYYRDTEMAPVSVELRDEERNLFHETNTLFHPSTFPTEELNLRDINISDFTEEMLHDVGISNEDTWNGNSSAYLINENSIEVAKSDYYTRMLHMMYLYLEAANVIKQSGWNPEDCNVEEFTARNELLQTRDDFKSPEFVRSADIGAVLFVKKGKNWYIILGKRSAETSINTGLLSIIPNGGMEYSDFSKARPVEYAAIRQFKDEVTLGRHANIIENVSEVECSKGYNVRDGSLSVVYPIFIELNQGADMERQIKLNNEFTEIVPVNVRNEDDISSNVTMEHMSPENVGKVFKCISNYEERFELPYSIRFV